MCVDRSGKHPIIHVRTTYLSVEPDWLMNDLQSDFLEFHAEEMKPQD